MRIQYWMASKLTLLIVPAVLVFVTNAAADPKIGPAQSSLLSPQPPAVNRSAFDQFSPQDTGPANPIIFGSGSPLIDLQEWETVTKLNQESSESSTDTWRPGQPLKLNESLFNNDFHFSGMKNIHIPQPAAQDDCVDVDDECTQNSGLPHSRLTKIHSGNFNIENFNKVRKPLIGLTVSVPIQ